MKLKTAVTQANKKLNRLIIYMGTDKLLHITLTFMLIVLGSKVFPFPWALVIVLALGALREVFGGNTKAELVKDMICNCLGALLAIFVLT